MKIIFRGLMAHVKEGDTFRRCVLVREETHKPVLIAANSCIKENHEFPVLKSPHGFTWFDLKGLIVTVAGLRPSPLTWETPFEKAVPSLTNVLKFHSGTKRLDDRIYSVRLHANAFSYIDLDGGRLDMLDCFDRQAKFDEHDPEKDPSCVARHVILYSENTDAVRFTNDDGNWVEIKAAATVQIFNRSGTGNHFQMYLDLALSYAHDIRSLEAVADDNGDAAVCAGCLPVYVPALEKHGTTSVSEHHHGSGNAPNSPKPTDRGSEVECTNSHWP